MSSPSTPGAPLLVLTRLSACCIFSFVSAARSSSPALLTLCPEFQGTGRRFRHRWGHARLHRALLPQAPLARASDAIPLHYHVLLTLLHVWTFVSLSQLLRPLLTSRSSRDYRPFGHEGISPSKNAFLHCTSAGSTPLRLDHESFVVTCPLALLGSAFYPVLVHRLAIYAPRFLPTLGRPHAVALHFARCDQLATGLAPVGLRPY